MRVRTVLGELLPVIGTVGLLGLWLFQQTGIETRNSQLRKLATAQAGFHCGEAQANPKSGSTDPVAPRGIGSDTGR